MQQTTDEMKQARVDSNCTRPVGACRGKVEGGAFSAPQNGKGNPTPSAFDILTSS